MLPIVYINLASDTTRRERMDAEFARHGLPGQRFDATRWTDLPPAEQARYYSAALNRAQFHKPLVNGEKGCYASHLRAWAALLESPDPAWVVLEDDVALTPALAPTLAALASSTGDWDMVKLIGRLEGAQKTAAALPLSSGHELVRYRRVPSLTAGYVISRRGAQKLLASRQPFGRPIDVDLRHWWENGLDIRGVLPAVIELAETSFDSSIGDKPKDRSLAGQFRKFRHKAAYSLLNAWHRQA